MQLLILMKIADRDWHANWIGLSSVLHPRQHSIGHMGDGFYRHAKVKKAWLDMISPTEHFKLRQQWRILESTLLLAAAYRPWCVASTLTTQPSTTERVDHNQLRCSLALHDRWPTVVYQLGCSHSATVGSHEPTSSPDSHETRQFSVIKQKLLCNTWTYHGAFLQSKAWTWLSDHQWSTNSNPNVTNNYASKLNNRIHCLHYKPLLLLCIFREVKTLIHQLLWSTRTTCRVL